MMVISETGINHEEKGKVDTVHREEGIVIKHQTHIVEAEMCQLVPDL